MRVFVTDLNMSPADAARLTAALPPSAAHRAGNLAATVGFLLVRYALYRLDPHVSADNWQRGENGKPRLPAGKPYFNLSHSRYGVAVIVCEQNEVGVDLEEIKPHPLRFAKRYYSENEQAMIASSAAPESEMIRIWTAKEAEGKRLSTGLSGGIAHIPIQTAASIQLTLGEKPHWLSVAPTDAMPPIEWVTVKQLLQ